MLKKLELTKEALDVLVEAVNLEPMHWGGWLELSLLVTDRDMVGCQFCSKIILNIGTIISNVPKLSVNYLIIVLTSIFFQD